MKKKRKNGAEKAAQILYCFYNLRQVNPAVLRCSHMVAEFTWQLTG